MLKFHQDDRNESFTESLGVVFESGWGFGFDFVDDADVLENS